MTISGIEVRARRLKRIVIKIPQAVYPAKVSSVSPLSRIYARDMGYFVSALS